TPINRRRVLAVVIWPIGMGSEVNRRTQRRKRDVRPLLHVPQHLPRRRRITRPDFEIGREQRRDIVKHAHSRCRIAHKSAKMGWKRLFFRNSTPSEPPVPCLLPIVRSTSFTWR